MTPLAAFIVGISTGGLTCMAVQGGLLLGLLAQDKNESNQSRRTWSSLLLPVSAFLLAKILAYALLGLGLGAIGSTLQLSSGVSVWLQTLAGLIMVITGIKIFFPRWLPWFTFTPPATIRRYIRRQTKSDMWVAPAFLGLLTVLIPCGTTIAIETAAVTTGSAIQGALLLAAFVAGTAPVFFIVGLLAKGTTLVQRRLLWVPAVLVIGLGLYALNGALVMVDSPYSFQNETRALSWVISGGADTEPQTAATQAAIIVRGTGYTPSAITVAAGKPVTLNLDARGSLGCTSVFRIPKLKIEKTLMPDTTNNLVATFPTAGTYSFSCGMGMYTGTITAI